jgi:hypothetical protein
MDDLAILRTIFTRPSDTFLSILTSISALSRSFSSLRNSVAAPAAADDDGDDDNIALALAG